MTPLERMFAGVTLVALATTLVLPGRQTPAIAKAVFGGLTRLFGTVIAVKR